MRIFLLFISLYGPLALAAAINPYQPRPECLDSINRTKGVEVRNLPPVRDQDGIGLCYAFSSAAILEQLHCRRNGLDCKDPSLRLSPLNLAANSTGGRGIFESGIAGMVLIHTGLKKEQGKKGRGPLVVREACAPFSRLQAISKIEHEKDLLTSTAKGVSAPAHPLMLEPHVGWSNLQKVFLSSRSAKDRSEWGQCTSTASMSMPGLHDRIKSVQFELAKAFSTFEEFAGLILIPQECETPERALELPKFEVGVFPEPKVENIPPKLVLSKAERLIEQNTPVELGLCTRVAADGVCNEGHSVVLTGSRECCDAKGECRRALRILNSYGVNWQTQNSEGWVDAEQLFASAGKMSVGARIVWVQAEGETISLAAPKTAPPPAKKGIYKCRLANGKTEYSDHDIGNCRPVN